MERWDLYTKDRVKTHRQMLRGMKQPDGFYRVVVHICVFNSNGEMLIQQRQPFKSGWSNLWDLTAGGSVIAGETSAQAAQRELDEEIGLLVSLEQERPRLTVNFYGGFDDIYMIREDVELSALRLQEEEVQAVRWASMDEILHMIEEGTFIPYSPDFIRVMFFLRDQEGMHMRGDFTRTAR
jgi:isopentenyldiphosphate isomerase